eukprot:SAG22_NODE_1530_length_4216_cov_5.617926_2_plen_84_part_00
MHPLSRGSRFASWTFHTVANRSIPVDLIIVDWMHWKVQGDWQFDSTFWPDPKGMVREINGDQTNLLPNSVLRARRALPSNTVN